MRQKEYDTEYVMCIAIDAEKGVYESCMDKTPVYMEQDDAYISTELYKRALSSYGDVGLNATYFIRPTKIQTRKITGKLALRYEVEAYYAEKAATYKRIAGEDMDELKREYTDASRQYLDAAQYLPITRKRIENEIKELEKQIAVKKEELKGHEKRVARLKSEKEFLEHKLYDCIENRELVEEKEKYYRMVHEMVSYEPLVPEGSI